MKKVNRFSVLRVNEQEYMQQYSLSLPETMDELVTEYGESEVIKMCCKMIENEAREYHRRLLQEFVRK